MSDAEVGPGITDFIAACLDQDRAAAEAAQQVDPAPWRAEATDDGPGPEFRPVQGGGVVIAADGIPLWDSEGSFLLCMTAPTTRHVARYDPAAVLRDIAAKRRVLARHQPIMDALHFPTCGGCGYDYAEPTRRHMIYECPELRDLAEPYSDRPGYNPWWAPDEL